MNFSLSIFVMFFKQQRDFIPKSVHFEHASGSGYGCGCPILLSPQTTRYQKQYIESDIWRAHNDNIITAVYVVSLIGKHVAGMI